MKLKFTGIGWPWPGGSHCLEGINHRKVIMHARSAVPGTSRFWWAV